MKCVFQIVHGPDGRRSPAAEATREEFAAILKRESVPPDCLVLVVFHESHDGMVLSQAPFMKVSRFIEEFYDASAERNERAAAFFEGSERGDQPEQV